MFHRKAYLCNYPLFHTFMNFLKKLFRYLEPAWIGNDGKISLRASLAIIFSISLIRNLSYAIRQWDAGRSLEGLSLTLGIEAGLIVGLLGLTTYQNLSMFGKGENYGYRDYNNPRNRYREKDNKKDDVTREEGKADIETPE